MGDVVPFTAFQVALEGTSVPPDPLDRAVDQFVVSARREGIVLDRDHEIIVRLLLWDLIDFAEGLHRDPTWP